MMAITENVPTTEKGSARLGIAVARRFRRKMKITITTRARLKTMVNGTCLKDFEIERTRSTKPAILIEGGICCLKTGRIFFTASAISTVLAPGCRGTQRMMALRTKSADTDQLAVLSSSTLSTT